ncbi:MAG: type II secretion system F family protein [Verrucomicrobiota bacterium]|nr:type II secretion system F family protein [Verrucomicrobiota bacterium]
MAIINTGSLNTPQSRQTQKKKLGFAESQRLAKLKSYERAAKRKKIKMQSLCVFTQQLSSMLEAGLPLVSALEALQDQTEDPVFQVIIRDVRIDISSGTAFSAAVTKFPNAFPNLFVSMVEAGEASGGLATILGKVAIYFESSVKLMKKVKGAMTYPAAVIGLSIGLVNVLLIFVIPVFAEMFAGFGAKLPAPTQALIDVSDFMKSNIIYIIIVGVIIFKVLGKFFDTPKGRIKKDQILFRIPIVGALIQKIAISRFSRTYAILLRSGVPILRSIEIVSKASGNSYVQEACTLITRTISQGGQLSDVVATLPYFPPTLKHMARAGEQTGNVDGMLNKVADFYDNEIDNTVAALTSLMEPLLICFLGVFVGGIVMCMFLPIFNMAGVVGGNG